MEAKWFVPAHAEVSEDVSALAQYNIDKVLEIAEKITGICQGPLCFEAILQRLFSAYGLTMNFQQYVLVGSTIRSYLAWLKDGGRLEALFEDNMLLWRRYSPYAPLSGIFVCRQRRSLLFSSVRRRPARNRTRAGADSPLSLSITPSPMTVMRILLERCPTTMVWALSKIIPDLWIRTLT